MRQAEHSAGRGAEKPAAGAEGLSTVWHVPLLLLVSVGFESLFLHHGIGTLDEAWPLYAVRGLREGGTLYRDVFFVFPPGHLLGAWIGSMLDPPGILAARGFYAAFHVAACLGIYAIGRRVMPASYALLGGLLVAVGAPHSHLNQLLLGYRYVVLALLALLAFGRHLDTGSRRFVFLAGVAIGVCLLFRLSPAFAAVVAIGVGILVSDRRARVRLLDLSALALGLGVVALPALAFLSAHVGLETIWTELVVRPAVMVGRQSLPLPGIAFPDEWTRHEIRRWFVGVQYRGYAGLYAVYLAVLTWNLVGALRRRARFEHPFLLTVVVLGAVYFVRTLGRADEPHLDSALPPCCLLVAHATSQLRRLPWPRRARVRLLLGVASAAGVFALFVFLAGSDHLAAREQRGRYALQSTGGTILATNPFVGRTLDWFAVEIRRRTEPDDIVLDLSASPILFILSDRDGPGGSDLIMPGTFLDEAEEKAFVDRLARRPPALVVWPKLVFDLVDERRVEHTAPRLVEWVRTRYREIGRHGHLALWGPKDPEPRVGASGPRPAAGLLGRPVPGP